MTARIHPGEVILSMDHSVITLRDAAEVETAMISVYDIAYSLEVGGGHVVLLRVPSMGIETVFADTIELGERMQARLRGIGMAQPMLEAPPLGIAEIQREAFIGDGFGYRFRAEGIEVRARWEDAEQPFFAEGPAPSFSEREDIWSVFVAFRRASIEVNGETIAGDPWDEDVWRPRLPRAVSSAHSALGETRLRPHPDRVPG